MKALPCALFASAVLLSGCAGSSHQTETSSSSVHWWNPLSYSWSSALPWNWFGASIAVSEQGVGKLPVQLPLTLRRLVKVLVATIGSAKEWERVMGR